MATGGSSAESCVAVSKDDYSHEFHRILFLLREFRSVRSTYLFFEYNFFKPSVDQVGSLNEYFLEIQKLPRNAVRSLDRLIVSYYQAPEDYPKEPDLNPRQRRIFLLLLGELRNGLEDGSIEPGLRSALLVVLTYILGPHCYQLMSRVLYYLYPPPGPFVPKEDPDDPSALGDAKEIYPTEYLVIALQYQARGTLSDDEFDRYDSIWEEVCERINGGSYGTADSMETVRQFFDIVSNFKIFHPEPYYRDLMQLVLRVPWPHRAKSPVEESPVEESPSTKTCCGLS